MANRLRVAVLGTGALGREHVRIYAQLAAHGQVHLGGIYDINPQTARTVAGQFATTSFRSFEEAAEAADAFSIATPTHTHYALARPLLQRGKHVLIEKPMTDSAAQAAELVELARANRCILQVGHVERFNPVFQVLRQAAPEPRFIEAHRLSPYPGRSTDIGVVLDLMIHDLDVVLAFVNSPVVGVDAVGVAVLSASEDIANARLRFANGCIANLTASRVSADRMRKIRVFSAGPSPSYISLDYRAQTGFIYRLAREGEAPSSPLRRLVAGVLGLGGPGVIISEFAGKRIVREPVPIIRQEPLRLELEHFIACVRERQIPAVSGESAQRALDLAFEITRQIQTGGRADSIPSDVERGRPDRSGP